MCLDHLLAPSCLILRRPLAAAACVVFASAFFAIAQETPPPAKPEPSEAPATVEPEKAPAKPDTPDTPPPADQPDAPSPADDRRGPTDRAELETFIDGIMAVHMKDKHIAGATISVVVDNQPFFSKGYGYADLAAKKPVDPDTTMFRIGSVSKLLTWTAVMQLAEAGKLDLDADINTYLKDFKIPPTYPQPITLKHLLTHTPGFEDVVIGLFARQPEKDKSLGELLSEQIPARVRPPGELASYSNHGTAIAGYIVSQVSGMPWEDYVEQKILEPLGMKHTLVRQPRADEMPAEMSKGYKFENGRHKEEGFEYIPLAPAGTIGASAGDMARFMIAHLQDGRFESAQILKEETARRMRELLFTHDQRLDGMAYGFMRQSYNGEEIVHHGGDTELFHSFFVMLPKRKTGFFVSYNTDTATRIRDRLLKSFVDRYFPAAEPPAQEKLPDSDESLDRFAGRYGAVRHSYTSIAKLGALFNVATLTADDGQLVLDAPGQDAKRFVPIEPLLFREVDGQDKLAFRQDDQGRTTHLFLGDLPPIAFEKLRWHQTPEFVLALVVICSLVFLSAVIGWPWAAFIARGVPRESTFGSRLASWLAWLASLGALAWLASALYLTKEPDELVYGMSPQLNAVLWTTPLIAALVAVVLLLALVAWLRGYWRISGRLHYTCVVLAAVAFVWFLHDWNLLRLGI
jgi:CubicO group peptidase (beta-lactamase class C family)